MRTSLALGANTMKSPWKICQTLILRAGKYASLQYISRYVWLEGVARAQVMDPSSTTRKTFNFSNVEKLTSQM